MNNQLESIEKRVQEYKPRMEDVLGIEIGDVKVKKSSLLYRILAKKHTMLVRGRTISVNQEWLNRTRMLGYAGQYILNVSVVHELSHILDNNNHLIQNIKLPYSLTLKEYVNIIKHITEGFAEYVCWEFPEIYPEGTLIYVNKLAMRDSLPQHYTKGYEFFKKVGNKIGKKNILKVFDNPPQSMEEILEPEKYLKRVGEK